MNENNPSEYTSSPRGQISVVRILITGIFVVAFACLTEFILSGRHNWGSSYDFRIQLIKLWALNIAGYGGLVTLWVALRRQWHAEESTRRDHDLADRVATQDLRDATERRANALYTDAATQLASDKAAVRLAGLHSFDRLGHAYPDYRQTVMDVLCSYLRMPPTPELTHYFEANGDADLSDQGAAEHEVRLTAQALIVSHFLPSNADNVWTVGSIDLRRAYLFDFAAPRAVFTSTNLNFSKAKFFGNSANFREVRFETEEVRFTDVLFASKNTAFDITRWGGSLAALSGTNFQGSRVTFSNSNFYCEVASFDKSSLLDPSSNSSRASFLACVFFAGTRIHADAVYLRDDLPAVLEALGARRTLVRYSFPPAGESANDDTVANADV